MGAAARTGAAWPNPGTTIKRRDAIAANANPRAVMCIEPPRSGPGFAVRTQQRCNPSLPSAADGTPWAIRNSLGATPEKVPACAGRQDATGATAHARRLEVGCLGVVHVSPAEPGRSYTAADPRRRLG